MQWRIRVQIIAGSVVNVKQLTIRLSIANTTGDVKIVTEATDGVMPKTNRANIAGVAMVIKQDIPIPKLVQQATGTVLIATMESVTMVKIKPSVTTPGCAQIIATGIK